MVQNVFTMKARFIFILLILSCFTGHAQWNIEWQNPLPHGNWLNKIHFSDKNYGWAVGQAGIIMKTHNGGNEWTYMESDPDEDLNDIAVIQKKYLWAVGNNGTILKSINGGSSWTDLSINTDQNLCSVFFRDPLTGWAGSTTGEIYHTQDGGFTWLPQNSGVEYPLNDLYFISDTVGWIACGGLGWFSNTGYLLTTKDAGENWQIISGDDYSYMRISFCDSVNGWIFTGHNGFQRTKDGGNTWVYHEMDNSLSRLHAVHFVDSLTGFLFRHALKRTLDGGLSWTPRIFDPCANDYCFISDKLGWACGYSGEIYHTISGGTSTILQTKGDPYTYFKDVFFISDKKGWAVGASSIYNTIDGGSTWIETTFPYTYFESIQFINETEGWAMANASTRILHTQDGGNNWELIGSAYGHAFFFASEHVGFTCGDEGVIYRTTDGGYNWDKMNSQTYKDLIDIYFVSPAKGWIVGYDGTILFTVDTGTTWTPQVPANLGSLFDVEFVDEMCGWISGGNENFMFTRDGGNTWTYQPLPTTGLYSYKSLSFCDSLHGFLGAYYYKDNLSPRFVLYYTSDGGYTWDQCRMRISQPITNISFPDENNGWVVGDRGCIVHIFRDSTSVYVPQIQLDTGDDMNIYPNPCRDLLQIDYSLENPDRINIAVYNSYGLKVFQKEFFAVEGNHSEYIDLSDLDPGIYFLALIKDESRISRKLILQ